ncbi:MAG: asparagine synthase (glutamine-hydrolyzing) [Kiloniellales bacterium]
MCGIFGIALSRPLSTADVAVGRAGRDALAHRGPDGAGEWSLPERGLFFGHRRLAIIDLSDRAAQPMARGPLVLCYNGEIYNYRELSDELAATGAIFRTESDSEVLLAAWERWGPAALDRLDGMFAFALFDGEQLHVATDPFGEKPLYWAEAPEGVYFASEPGPLIEALGLRFQPSREELETFLALGFLPAPATGFPRLHQLPAASHAELTPEGLRNLRRYWTPPPAVPQRGPLQPLGEGDLDAVHDGLLASLRRRLRADVPLGLFLSAGVDSSLIAALVVKDLGVDLTAQTVSFPDGADEADTASRIAQHLGLRHRVIDSREARDWRRAPESMVELFGVPNDNTSAMSVRQMSSLARGEIKVALSGLGGDELFYGYNRYRFLWEHRTAYRLPGSLLDGLAPFRGVVRRLPQVGAALDTLAGPRAWRFLSIKNGSRGDIVRRLPRAVEGLADRFPEDGRDLVFQARDFDVMESLPAGYIPAVDRGSMRVGLEVRTPFLCRALAELLAGFDARALVGFGQKSVLRRLLARYLPNEFVERPKQGFAFPAGRYLGTRPAQVPRSPGVDHALAAAVWARRSEPGYQALAMRLCLLEAMELAVPA